MKHITAVDMTAVLWIVVVTSVPLVMAKKPMVVIDRTCSATSSALIAFKAELQLVHCTTCDQYLWTPVGNNALHPAPLSLQRLMFGAISETGDRSS
jgi:hypothetical protein